jgi:hypothetical protein
MPLLILILAIVFIPVAPTTEYLHIVFINTPVDQSLVDDTQSALDYWSAAKPANIAIGAVSSQEIETDILVEIVNTFHDELTLYIINQDAALLTGNDGYAHGVAMPYEFAAVTIKQPIGNTETIIAHELGHLIYGLGELCGGTGSDIMCNPISAYPHRYGCATLGKLGRPCFNLSLPIMHG